MKNIIWYILVSYCGSRAVSDRYEIEPSPVYPNRFGVYDNQENRYVMYADDPDQDMDTSGFITLGPSVVTMGSLYGTKPVEVLNWRNNTLSLDSAIMILRRIEKINP